MLIQKTKIPEILVFLAYILVLFVSAILRDFVIVPLVTQSIKGPEAVVIEPIWKLLFWIAPTFLYIRFIDGQKPLTSLKLSMPPQRGLSWGLYGCAIIAAVFAGTIIRVHTFHVPSSIDTWVNVILLVGFMEEIPFRGFLFQKLQSFFGASWAGFVGAMLLSSLLFALIHTPLWVSTGQPLSLLGFFEVFMVGILACAALKLSDSLWSCILIHTFYNLLSSIL